MLEWNCELLRVFELISPFPLGKPRFCLPNPLHSQPTLGLPPGKDRVGIRVNLVFGFRCTFSQLNVTFSLKHARPRGTDLVSVHNCLWIGDLCRELTFGYLCTGSKGRSSYNLLGIRVLCRQFLGGCGQRKGEPSRKLPPFYARRSSPLTNLFPKSFDSPP